MKESYCDPITVFLLKKHPGHYVITPNGLKLYALGPNDCIIEFSGRNFNEMTADEINQAVVDYANNM